MKIVEKINWKIIHNETKGKVTWIGFFGLLSEKHCEITLKFWFWEFIETSRDNMLKKELGILLKGKKMVKLIIENPKKY